MEVHLSPELEAKVARSAAEQGCDPDKFVQEIVTRHFEEEARFLAAVRRGEEPLDRGEFLTHEEVGKRMGRFLRR